MRSASAERKIRTRDRGRELRLPAFVHVESRERGSSTAEKKHESGMGVLGAVWLQDFSSI